MENIVGNIAEGEDFFPRDKFINRFWRKLKSQNYLLSAPRRSGKSSILTAMKNSNNNSFHFIYLDVEGISTELEFFDEIIEVLKKYNLIKESIYKKIKAKLPSKLEIKNITFEKSSFNLNEFIDDLNSIESEKIIILAIDEFSMLLTKLINRDLESAKNFLDMNRYVRQNESIRKKFKFILTGSIGLSNIVEKIEYSKATNDLDSITLEPLSIKEAKEFLTKLFESYEIEFDENNLEYILNKISWYMPFFLQLIFKYIEEVIYEKEEKLSNELIDEAYEKIFHHSNKKHFSHWIERLSEAYSKDEKNFLIETLKFIAMNEESDFLDIHNIFTNYILDKDIGYYLNSLEYDGYILKVNQKYKFVSPILREYWRRNV